MAFSNHVFSFCARLSTKNIKLLYKFIEVPKFLENTTQFVCTSIPQFGTDRRFTNKHEWIQIEGNVGTIGISQYYQDSLGDVVYAQLPEVGTVIGQNDECGALESVKAACELYSPVSGKVIAKNRSVEQNPGLINNSCYNKGWLFQVDLTKPDELKGLMSEKEYEQFLNSENV